jgi:hypothetical protein
MDEEDPLVGSFGDRDGNRSRAKCNKTQWAFRALVVLVACQGIAVRIMSLPLNRVIESRYCFDYFLDHDPSVIGPGGEIAEELCKIDLVQEQLAWLQGSIETLHILCGM